MNGVQELRRYEDDFRVWYGCYRNMHFLSHWHRELELLRVAEGSVAVTVEGKTLFLREGDLLLCGSECVHRAEGGGENRLEFLLFDPAFVRSVIGTYQSGLLLSAGALEAAGLQRQCVQTFARIQEELAQRRPYYQSIVAGLLQQLWAALCRAFPDILVSKQRNSRTEKLMEKLTEYLAANFRERITLEDAAKQVYLSKYRLSHLFVQHTGFHLVEYVNYLRVEAAVDALRRTDRPITQVAYENGFRDISTFNRVFRRYTGHAPGDYRRDVPPLLGAVCTPLNKGETLVVTQDSPVVQTAPQTR